MISINIISHKLLFFNVYFYFACVCVCVCVCHIVSKVGFREIIISYQCYLNNGESFSLYDNFLIKDSLGRYYSRVISLQLRRFVSWKGDEKKK